MIIEYKKPLFLKKKIVDTNILMDKNFTINIDFKVEEGHKKDDKIGFFGIPGRNFGISYDYKVKSFVFEYWTIDDKNESNFNCEITDLMVDSVYELHVPHRRKSLFETLPHEENGFLDNKWKDQSTRWNQLRFINEVSTNHELLYNDGLSDLEFVEHGIINENNITFVTVGI